MAKIKSGYKMSRVIDMNSPDALPLYAVFENINGEWCNVESGSYNEIKKRLAFYRAKEIEYQKEKEKPARADVFYDPDWKSWTVEAVTGDTVLKRISKKTVKEAMQAAADLCPAIILRFGRNGEYVGCHRP